MFNKYLDIFGYLMKYNKKRVTLSNKNNKLKIKIKKFEFEIYLMISLM